MNKFRNKNILVTGGSKGIGRACVESFSAAGAKVIFTYRSDDDSLKTLLERYDRDIMVGVQFNSLHYDSYPRFVDTVKDFVGNKLDVLVNNVGDPIRRSSFEESDDDLWNDCLSINLLTTIKATRLFLPMLRKSEKGVIVNISSIAGTTTGAGDSLHYGVAKSALDTFTRGLAREMTDGAIRVVGVAPSAIDTDFQTRHSDEDRLQKIVGQTPIGRIGTVNEVAETVLFLSSENASYISGDTLLMTGGR